MLPVLRTFSRGHRQRTRRSIPVQVTLGVAPGTPNQPGPTGLSVTRPTLKRTGAHRQPPDRRQVQHTASRRFLSTQRSARSIPQRHDAHRTHPAPAATSCAQPQSDGDSPRRPPCAQLGGHPERRLAVDPVPPPPPPRFWMAPPASAAPAGLLTSLSPCRTSSRAPAAAWAAFPLSPWLAAGGRPDVPEHRAGKSMLWPAARGLRTVRNAGARDALGVRIAVGATRPLLDFRATAVPRSRRERPHTCHRRAGQSGPPVPEGRGPGRRGRAT